jgi:hypothetical protein
MPNGSASIGGNPCETGPMSYFFLLTVNGLVIGLIYALIAAG